MQSSILVLSATEVTELAQYEATIERGIQTFIDVGVALLAIREKRLWRHFGTFENYCNQRWGWSARHAMRLTDSASVIRNITSGPIGPDVERTLPETESQARPLTALRDQPELQREVWQRAVETAPNGKLTAAHVQSVVNEFVMVDQREQPSWYQSSESDDWWTPQWLFDLLHTEIGFETDVCASDANHKCARYFTREQDGLAQEWTGSCWMNPPYGRSGGVSIYAWTEKAYQSAMQGATVACLIPARTDTLWWWRFCVYGEVRFLKGRLKFSNSNSSAPFPSAVVIFWPFVPASRARVVWWEAGGASEVALESG